MRNKSRIGQLNLASDGQSSGNMLGASMLLTQVAECQKDLNFAPLKNWPDAFPAMAWKGQLLSGFERRQGPALELSHGASTSDFLEAFCACHPELSLPELAQIYATWSELSWLKENANHDWAKFFHFYGFRDSQILRQTLTALQQMPASFQSWVATKGLGPKDLAIFRSFTDPRDLIPAAEWLVDNQASKSTGVQCLETAGELRLMELEWEKVLPQEKVSPEQWLQQLKSQRNPMSQQKLNDKNKQLMRLPWPPHTQARWTRKGDETGLEIRMQVRSPADLKKTLAKLQKMEETLEQREESVWSQ